MKKDPYVDAPSGLEVIGWIALLLAFFWGVVWGLKYFYLALVWLVDFI